MTAKKPTSKKNKKKTKKAESKKSNKVETLLGIDYGEARIGLALGRAGLTLPLHIVEGSDSARAVSEIARVAIENAVDKIVMGLPLTADGKETYQSKQVRSFSKLLKIGIKIPLEFVNEYSSTVESLKTALDSGYSQKRRKEIDHISAAIILKNYYEAK